MNIDWENLPFGYYRTEYNVRCYYANGKWGELEVHTEETIPIHMAASSVQYGQQAFEGIKAFRGKDGKVRVFRLDENNKRLQASCEGIVMPKLPTELFYESVEKVIRLNEKFLPPYGTGASLYIRPILIGLTPFVGVHYASEYLYCVFVTPVGPYFKGGFNSTSKFIITPEYDRAAPLGTGEFKVGGNYAASLRANKKAHDLGYACEIYLDPKEKKYIDECGGANFFGIKNRTYITPNSASILPSITNKSLMQLAEDMGLKVEFRQVAVEELEEMEEAGACGTGAAISPIGQIDAPYMNKSFVYGDKPGPISTALYEKLQRIQYGEEPDTHNWNYIIEM